MQVYLLKRDKREIVDIQNELEAYYKELEIDIIDIQMRKIGGKWFNVICDDEGLLKPNYVSAIDENYDPMFVGNLILCHDNNEGELTGLDDGDIGLIEENLIELVSEDGSWLAVKMEY